MRPILLTLLALFMQIIRIFGATQIITITPSSDTQLISVTQSLKYQYFQIQQNPNLLTLKYVIFEFKIAPNVLQNILAVCKIPPTTCYDYESQPYMLIDPLTGELLLPCEKGFSYNQSTRANGIYSIIIPADVAFTNIFASFYVELNGASYTVKVRGRFSGFPFDICPFDCGMGVSSNLNCYKGKCKCPKGLIDDDCSQSATLISSDSVSLKTDPNNVVYAYYYPSLSIVNMKSAKDIVISFSLENKSPEVEMYLSMEGTKTSQKILPTQDYNMQGFSLQKGAQTLTLEPEDQYDTNLNPKLTVFGFQSSSMQQNSINVKVQGEEEQSMSTNLLIIFLLIGAIGLLFIIWIILTIIKIKNARRNRVVNLAAHQFQQQRIRSEQATKLTEDVIEKYMPAVPFSQIEKKEKERGKFIESCPVCLGDFESAEICRQAVCNHYFHKDCLESWLKKQENCPFCRADLSTTALCQGIAPEIASNVRRNEIPPPSSSYRLQDFNQNPHQDNILQPLRQGSQNGALQIGNGQRQRPQRQPGNNEQPSIHHANQSNNNLRIDHIEQAPHSSLPLIAQQQTLIISNQNQSASPINNDYYS